MFEAWKRRSTMPNIVLTKTTNQSVERAMNLLSLFSHRHSRWGITESSRILGLSKGTVHGLARTLLKTGFLQQDSETRKYQLGSKIFELGVVLAGSLEINQKATGPASQLVKRTNLTSRIAIQDADSALVTLNIDPRLNTFFSNQIGPRVPKYCSAIGKSILAFMDDRELNAYLDRTELIPFTSKTITRRKQLLRELEETHRRGYSIDREETILGIGCIGAPIFGQEGRVVASISLSGDPYLIFGKHLGRLVEELRKTAREISRSMGYSLEAFRGTRILKNR